MGEMQMAKGKGSFGGNETVKPPNKGELRDASKQIRGGHSAAAKRMADTSVTKHQGARRGGGGGRGR
jgi:hypothetical protein